MDGGIRSAEHAECILMKDEVKQSDQIAETRMGRPETRDLRPATVVAKQDRFMQIRPVCRKLLVSIWEDK